MADQPVQQPAVGVEDVNKTASRARRVIVLVRLLLGECHQQLAAVLTDAEGRKTRGQPWVGENIDQVEVSVEHFDGTEAEVGRKEEFAGVGGDQRQALVHCPAVALGVDRVGAIHREHGVVLVDSWIPSGDGAVLTGKDEERRTRHATFRDDEIGRLGRERVERLTGRSAGAAVARSRNVDHQRRIRREGIAGAVIQRRHAGVVV